VSSSSRLKSQRVRCERHFVIPLSPPSPRVRRRSRLLILAAIPFFLPAKCRFDFGGAHSLRSLQRYFRLSLQSFLFTLQLNRTQRAPLKFHFYRAICCPKHTRPLLCTGRGDAFDKITFPSESAFASIDFFTSLRRCCYYS